MMYLLGFVAGYWVLRHMASRRETGFRGERIMDFLAHAAPKEAQGREASSADYRKRFG